MVAGAKAQEGFLHIFTMCSPTHRDHQLTLIHICKGRGFSGEQKPCLCTDSLGMVCSMGSPFSREMEVVRDELRALFTPWLNKNLARASCPTLSGFNEPEL